MFMLCTSNTSVDLRRLGPSFGQCALYVEAASIGETKDKLRVASAS